MIKTILVPVAGDERDAACFATAFSVARILGVHVTALHVRVDPAEVAMTMSTEGAGGLLLEGIIDGITRDADEREKRARSGFDAFCAREALATSASPEAGAKPSAELHVETGAEARWMAAYGMTADLIIASRGGRGNSEVARSALETLLLETGRPLLIPGDTSAPPAPAERVAIAWKPVPQAARAVSYAMPFLVRAKEVAVLTVEEDGIGSDDAKRLVSYLAWHGINAAAQQLELGPDGAAATLLGAAAAGSQMLVMGGYGHTRLREWVFGGFTKHALSEAPLAVLMAH
jgi:nucleotide-binding universal stress UspA family protein